MFGYLDCCCCELQLTYYLPIYLGSYCLTYCCSKWSSRRLSSSQGMYVCTYVYVGIQVCRWIGFYVGQSSYSGPSTDASTYPLSYLPLYIRYTYYLYICICIYIYLYRRKWPLGLVGIFNLWANLLQQTWREGHHQVGRQIGRQMDGQIGRQVGSTKQAKPPLSLSVVRGFTSIYISISPSYIHTYRMACL